MCRELCEQTPQNANPGMDLKQPETIKPGDLVLVRRDVVATNMINSVLKLTRIYTSKAYRVEKVSGNQYAIRINGVLRTCHHKNLWLVSP